MGARVREGWGGGGGEAGGCGPHPWGRRAAQGLGARLEKLTQLHLRRAKRRCSQGDQVFHLLVFSRRWGLEEKPSQHCLAFTGARWELGRLRYRESRRQNISAWGRPEEAPATLVWHSAATLGPSLDYNSAGLSFNYNSIGLSRLPLEVRK